MSRLARSLCTLYGATALWLAWCTVTTFGYAPLWASTANFAASIVCVIAIVNTSADADEHRALRVQLERATRPAEPPAILTPGEQAVFDQIAGAYDDTPEDHT